MPSWKGNLSNPVPNSVQETVAKAEKRTEQNRSLPVRRDTDVQKNNTITMMDVDQVILNHLEQLKISVVDEGNVIKVPIIYGSPEKWVSARRDGYLRDKQGKVQLPMILFKRTNSENNDNIEMFNRYIKYPVMKKYSQKNRYTQFSVLTTKNAPVNEVFNITMADHMIFTYSFMVWTEYQEQMNGIIEKIKFNTTDYWGSKNGFKFRTQVEGFSHTTELDTEEDRIVKTDFDLMTYGYILPESYQLLDRQYPSTEKLFTPKKIIMGTEVVATDYDMTQLNNNSAKWRSQYYPNLKRGDEPLAPGLDWIDSGTNDATFSQPTSVFLQSLQVSNTADGITITSVSAPSIRWQSVPTTPTSFGQDGWMAYDNSYLYVYGGGSWKRIPINQFSA